MSLNKWSVVATIVMVGSARHGAAQSEGFQIGPDSLLFTDANRTASFTVRNGDAQPMDIWLGPACDAVTDSAEHGDPIAEAWHNRSSCVAPWLSGFPQHVTLAPHEQRTIPVQLTPPVTLPDGHYTARMIWATRIQGGVMHSELAIKYAKGPPVPRKSRMQWQATSSGGLSGVVLDTPAVLVLDEHTTQAHFTLINSGATSTEMWLTVDCPWFRVNFINYPDSHQYESAWHGRIPSAAFWLGGYPQHLMLAPHERRTIAIQAFPALRPGQWGVGSDYARIVFTQSPILTVTTGGDTTYVTPHGAINVVYHQGMLSPLTLSNLQRTPKPDGTSQACVTVQQPGIGVVAVLHAEVDDDRGHPMRARGSNQAWRMDTTVAVWEVVHHNPMDGAQDGEGKSPDPVCFALPNFAPGKNQLVVAGATLEDTAEHHAVRAVLPLEPVR